MILSLTLTYCALLKTCMAFQVVVAKLRLALLPIAGGAYLPQ